MESYSQVYESCLCRCDFPRSFWHCCRTVVKHWAWTALRNWAPCSSCCRERCVMPRSQARHRWWLSTRALWESSTPYGLELIWRRCAVAVAYAGQPAPPRGPRGRAARAMAWWQPKGLALAMRAVGASCVACRGVRRALGEGRRDAAAKDGRSVDASCKALLQCQQCAQASLSPT